MEIVEFQKSFKNLDICLRPYIVVVSILICTLFLFAIFNRNLEDYYFVDSKVIDGKLSLLVDYNQLDKIVNNSKLIIDKNTFTYKVDKINDYNIDSLPLKEIVIVVKGINKELLIENNILHLKIVTNKTSIFRYLINIIKGEWIIKEVTEKELKQLNGGGLSLLGLTGIISGAIFLIGVIDGYVRPLKCNE